MVSGNRVVDYFNYITSKLNFSIKKRLPIIIQSEASECGLACLAMVAGFYGYETDLVTLRKRFNIPSQGLTLKTLNQIVTQMDFKSRALSVGMDELSQLKTPCILHWDMNHFVVLAHVNKEGVIIHDPAIGKRKVSFKECSNHFTGIALEIWPDNKFERKVAKSKIRLTDLFNSVVGLKPALTKIFFISLIIESINLLTPIGTQLVMDHVLPAKDKNLLLVICLGLVAFMFFRTFVSMFRAWISLTISILVDIQWKISFFDFLFKLPLDYFEKRKVGDIQSRFSSLDAIRATFTDNIISFIIDTIFAVGLIMMMWLYGGWLVFVVILFTLVYAAIRTVMYAPYKALSEELIVKGAKANSHFMESLYGVTTIKSLGLEDNRSKFWLNLNIDTANVNIKTTQFNMLFSGINTFIASIDQIVVLWLGASLVIDNEISLGMFIAFNAYRGQFSQRATGFINTIFSFKLLSLHNERISDIIFTDKEKFLPEKTIFNRNEPYSIELKSVDYQYTPFSPAIIKDFSLKVAPGESIAIVGPSGVGKSTLLKIMCGLLTPQKGEILINDVDLSHLGINNYRRDIACVLQEDKLFSGTLLQNIACFDEQPDVKLAVTCAVYCNIHNEIAAMPMGYETLVGELGTGLSGGQKQRILLARALYKRPSILFMDEATSHLDVANESVVNQAIATLKITRIIVAHRESTIQSADRIIDLTKTAVN